MLTLPFAQALTFDDVLLVPGASNIHPNNIDLRTIVAMGIRLEIPILSAAMDTVTESKMAIALAQQGGIGIIHKNLSIDRQASEIGKVKHSALGTTGHQLACQDPRGRLRVGAALGIGSELLHRAKAMIDAQVDLLCLDSSHGHSIGVINALQELRNAYPSIPIIAGNVATYEGAKALCQVGASAIKVGIGPGSICTTRIVTGVGMPQLTAIIEASRACREFNVQCIADGGIKFSGDITKAIAAGADCVMIGSLFAGTEEAPGEMVSCSKGSFKSYRGMGSISAMSKGSKDRYFQDGKDCSKLVPEGVEGQVRYVGPLNNVITQLLGGIRAGMGLVGGKNIHDFQQKARFVQISTAGLRESHTHNVTITKEAPNYYIN
jgi:IMP dehydrogenase